MALIFVRHASTSLNAGDPAEPKDQFRGWTDAPLSDFGRTTMAQTAAWFRSVPLQGIISSDLPRAAESAEMISKATGVPVKYDPRLRPLNVGYLTGKDITPETAKVMEQAHQNRDMPLPGGESYNDFANRYAGIIPELLQAGQSGNVAVVTHHRNLLALPNMFFGKPLSTKGPPVPGGVMALTQKGLFPLYESPASASVYKEKAAS